MSTFRQLAAEHGILLVLDACSLQVQVGWCPAAGPAEWQSVRGEAGTALFQALAQLGHSATAAGAWVFSDGPGSILGVRTVAMALRTWAVLTPKPVYAYHSLAVVAAAFGDPSVTVIADARRDSWHRVSSGQPLARVPAAALTGRLVMPEGFRTWSTPPGGVQNVPYSLAALLPAVADADVFRPVDSPDAFLHEEPSYAKWTPQIHRAP